MRLRKNIARVTTFALVGALAATAFFAINNNNEEETSAIAGTWGNILNTAWANPEDARYKNYDGAPGSSESMPFLIQTAEEFSGIRAFEGGDDLAGKYLMLVADIDLSAHYWDPIDLRGKGNPVMDLVSGGLFTGDFEEANESEKVHIDGNSRKITGMTIMDTYDEAPLVVDGNDLLGLDGSIGATGLFSYLYKVQLTDLRLEKPTITLGETSGATPDVSRNVYTRAMVESADYGMYGEVPTVDLVGAVAGFSYSSRIADVHITGLNTNYTAKFGELFDSGNDCYVPMLAAIEDDDYDCPAYYSPGAITIGGAVGLQFGGSIIDNTSVKNGVVNAKPVVDETPYWGMSFEGNVISMGGLVGANLMSTILSTCSSADVVFSDDGYNLWDEPVSSRSMSVSEEEDADNWISSLLVVEAPSDRPLRTNMFFGGLAGISVGNIEEPRCILNSCSHSEINIDAEISEYIAVGGLAGAIVGDNVMNNYFDGTIETSEDNYVGEMVGALSAQGGATIDKNYYMGGRNQAYSMFDEDSPALGAGAFKTITTVEKLVIDLNSGREAVINAMMSSSNFSREYLSQRVVAWEMQDMAFPLACVDERSVGLKFDDKRVIVPNTGVGV